MLQGKGKKYGILAVKILFLLFVLTRSSFQSQRWFQDVLLGTLVSSLPSNVNFVQRGCFNDKNTTFDQSDVWQTQLLYLMAYD